MSRLVWDERRVWSFSLVFSLAVNLAVLAVISIYWLSFHYNRPEEEKPVVVELMEIPSPKKPQGTVPQTAELAELSPPSEMQKAEAQEVPQVKSEIASEMQQRKEQVRVPKPPVELPEAENIVGKTSPSGARLFNPGENIEVEESMKWQGAEAESTIKGQLDEAGQSSRLAHLAKEGMQRVESTVGETMATGELLPPTTNVEKRSPFTKRPIAVIVENAPQARPQAGLSKADVVYEIMAEGGITRFLAIFSSEAADRVGPVRSARPYFALKAMEHDAIFVHSGGSVEAYTYMKELALDHIDEMNHFQPFWREKERRPPHNLYTSVVSLRQEAQKLGYNRPVRSSGFGVASSSANSPSGKKASALEIRYAGDYAVKFTFNEGKREYARFVNEKPHIDSSSGAQISCSTVIVQVTEHVVKDAEGRLEIRFVGQGQGWVFSDGVVLPIRWEKKTLRDKTRFYYDNGEELRVNPGRVWIEIVDTKTKVVF
ncbi:MAG: DUF3048 domain-containing protein [Candidatus Atribacteria bacterium]|nr:DUF3048 domain-containing protein [Candidatus Atribacteria bacterium]